jgi:hypothetical protein
VEEIAGAPQRMADPHWWGKHRAALLEQEAEIRADSRGQRQDQAQDHGRDRRAPSLSSSGFTTT